MDEKPIKKAGSDRDDDSLIKHFTFYIHTCTHAFHSLGIVIFSKVDTHRDTLLYLDKVSNRIT